MAKRKSTKSVDSLAHKPMVLYRASVERIQEAGYCLKGRHWIAAMYLAGLAVECILQAIALHHGSPHDARHDLTKWLSKCPLSLQDTLKSKEIAGDWNRVATVWYNELRYLSEDGLFGHLRNIGRAKKIKGGREAILKENAKRLVESASAVHKKGLGIWHRFSTK